MTCSMMNNLTEKTQPHKCNSVNKQKASSLIQQPPDHHLGSDHLPIAATVMASALRLPAPESILYPIILNQFEVLLFATWHYTKDVETHVSLNLYQNDAAPCFSCQITLYRYTWLLPWHAYSLPLHSGGAPLHSWRAPSVSIY